MSVNGIWRWLLKKQWKFCCKKFNDLSAQKIQNIDSYNGSDTIELSSVNANRQKKLKKKMPFMEHSSYLNRIVQLLINNKPFWTGVFKLIIL